VNDNPSLEGGEDANYPDMFRRIISYLMTGNASDYADEIWAKALGPYRFEGEYGLGSGAAFAQGEATIENDAYSCKIDFSTSRHF
jgi:hypothetical protein